MGILGLFALGACNNKNTQGHEGHGHSTVTHNNDEHNHEAEGHDHEAEGHTHGTEGECNGDHKHDAADNHQGTAAGHDETAEAAHSDEIILPKAKADAAGVKVSIVEPAPFQQVIKTSGQVLAAQGDESVAVATVAGVVSFRGKVTEYERMKALVKNKIVSDKDFAQAEQNYENARISYEALAKNHSAIGQNITAPIAGYVKSILVKEGDYVTIGQPLVSVTQNRRLFLRAEVSEKYYPYLRTINSANFRTPYNNKVYELGALNGRLLSFGKTAGDNSFYVPVTFEFDNKGDIIAGSFVEVYLLSSQLENVLSLPRTALTEEQGIYFVYLQLDEEGYKKQEVTLGADNGKNVQILTGIKPGDRVVTEGAYQVRLASASNAIPAHSHEH